MYVIFEEPTIDYFDKRITSAEYIFIIYLKTQSINSILEYCYLFIMTIFQYFRIVHSFVYKISQLWTFNLK